MQRGTGSIQHTPLVTLAHDPVACKAGRALRRMVGQDLAMVRKGRLFATRLPQADDPLPPATTWEGRAKRGERFGIHVWDDQSLLLWRQQRGALWSLYPAPLALASCWNVQDRPYMADIAQGGPVLMAARERGWTNASVLVGDLFAGTPLPRAQRDPQDARALAITQAVLLQTLSNMMDGVDQHPLLMVPNDKARPKTNHVLAAFLLDAPVGGQHARDAVLKDLVMPILARAIVQKTFQGKARFEVESGLLAANGAIARPPQVRVDLENTLDGHQPAGHRSYLSMQAVSGETRALRTRLQTAFDDAWLRGGLGTPYAWVVGETARTLLVAELSVDSASLSAHRLLASVAGVQKKARIPHAPHPSA